MKDLSFPNNHPKINIGDIETPKNSLEFKTVVFTVSLYIFICLALLTVHYSAPFVPQASSAEQSSEDGGSYPSGGSSSGSPYNPK